MATPESDADRLRDRRAELQAASSARKLQRQEDARRLIDEANALTREPDDDEAGDEA